MFSSLYKFLHKSCHNLLLYIQISLFPLFDVMATSL